MEKSSQFFKGGRVICFGKDTTAPPVRGIPPVCQLSKLLSNPDDHINNGRTMNRQTRTPRLINSVRTHAAAFAMMGVVAATLLNSSAQAQLIVIPKNIESFTSFFGNRTPTNLINGSGLTAGASGILGAADSTHSNNEAQMWYSSPFLTPPDTTPIVTLNLGGVYDLQTTRLWQYNQPGGFTVYGAAEIELSVSTDNTNFTALSPTLFPTRAGGTNGEPAQDFSTPRTGVRYVRLQIFTTFGGAQATGLSEVRFVVASNTAPPVITSQPTNQTVAIGGTATFTVRATGPTPISYQWRQNGTNLTNGGNISGATSSNLVVNSVSLASEGNYNVVLTNINGSVTSSSAVLALAGPIITQQPQNSTNVVGQTASFIVTATDALGNPATLTFQWSKNGTNLVNGGNISGVTTTNLVVSNLSTNDAAGYRVLVTDNLGKVLLSRNAILIVAQLPTVGVTVINQPILAPTIQSVTSFFGPRPPVNMVNNSGLTAGPSGVLGAADSTHSNNDSEMWYSDPFLTPPDTTPIVVFNLGGVYDLKTTRLWQYNQAGGFTVYGAAEIELSFSSDNTNFTTLSPTLFPARAGGTNGEPAQDFSTPGTGVRYVRLQIFTTFGGAQATGLSEVRFVASGSKAAISLNKGVLGLHYRVEYRNSLNPANSWQLLQDIPTLSSTPLLVSDPASVGAQAQRYYRAVLVLP